MTLRLTSEPQITPEGVFLPLSEGSLALLPYAEGLLEVRVLGDAPLPDSPAALPRPEPGVDWRFEHSTLVMPGLRVRLAEGAVELTAETAGGDRLWTMAVTRENGKLTLSGDLAPDDAFFGLGEKPGFLDKRGRSYGMWNTDNPLVHTEADDLLYQSIPFVITWHAGKACGFLFDDPGWTRFDLGHHVPDRWQFTADGPGLRFFVAAGPAMAEVVSRYTRLTGRMPMPPRWALGYQQCRWSYETAEEIRRLAREYRTRQIPIDVLYLDIDYMDAYRVFTWHPHRFPEPKQLLGELREQHLRAVTIVDPGVKQDLGYPVFDQCLEQGFYVRNPDGSPYIGDVWPGPCVFPDFLRADVRRWWGDWHADWMNQGIAGIWNDMNEPAVSNPHQVPPSEKTMPMHVRHGVDGELSHRQAHNLYGFSMSQATREGLLRARPDERPFVITRAGYAGVQRHAMVWTGDNHAIWSHLEQGLPMVMNLGLSGVAFCGPDVGGFSGDCTAELLVRWTQAGAFTPFFRNHSAKGTRAQEPWTFDAETERRCREAIGWRYRLMPYLYTAFQEAASTGLPIARAMALAFPDDPEALRLHDQYMFGPDLLVAPVVKPGATCRLVYFPAGTWTHWLTGEPVEGGGFRIVPTPLDTLPVYLRPGAVLPVGPLVQHTDETYATLELHVAPGALSGRWYDDDGASFAFERGESTTWRFSGTLDGEGLRLEIASEHQGYTGTVREFEVVLRGEYGAATFDGPTDSRYAEGLTHLRIPARPGTLTARRL